MSNFGQQMFFARKRSSSDMFWLCESEATATCFGCAKAKRQQHVLAVRKRSDSNGTMLVTKALSQDVMLLAFVPL
ncbi:hypothetical protein P4562_01355 [Lysinibacillus xylanilyticus]|uniref:hypothetical protein n=1 Tax=Lysinibacillus xylanilyticus TaxID=582475 RepID=UPI002E1FD590|nr:hypothetical protein [Lysinibacillus xylanilyticus]